MSKEQISLKDYFVLKWQPFTNCNYSCSFCCQKNKSKSKIDTKKNITLIKNKILPFIKGDILLSMSGGEVTLLNKENIIFILEIIKPVVFYITTNFSADVEYYNYINEYCKNNNILFLLECSFHEEFVSEEIFFNKIKKLNFEVCAIQTVVTKNNQSFMNDLKSRHPEITFEPNIFDDKNDIDFDFKENEIYRYSLKNKNFNYGKKCLQNQISIKENGDVYNNNCKQIKYGNLNNKILIPKFPFFITCSNKICKGCHIQEIL